MRELELDSRDQGEAQQEAEGARGVRHGHGGIRVSQNLNMRKIGVFDGVKKCQKPILKYLYIKSMYKNKKLEFWCTPNVREVKI